MKKELAFYETAQGKTPFQKWLEKLKDVKGRAKIQTRLNRLIDGNYGDCKHLKQSVYELRIDYGPGYRIYFAELKKEFVILLLLAGTKRTQQRDIDTALEYWESFKERFDNG